MTILNTGNSSGNKLQGYGFVGNESYTIEKRENTEIHFCVLRRGEDRNSNQDPIILKLQTRQHADRLYEDMEKLGQPGFVAKEQYDVSVCDHVSQNFQKRPYRDFLLDNHKALLNSTSRHVESILSDLLNDAPFLRRNLLSLYSSDLITEQIFRSSVGWVNCGRLNTDIDGALGYMVKNVRTWQMFLRIRGFSWDIDLSLSLKLCEQRRNYLLVLASK